MFQEHNIFIHLTIWINRNHLSTSFSRSSNSGGHSCIKVSTSGIFLQNEWYTRITIFLKCFSCYSKEVKSRVPSSAITRTVMRHSYMCYDYQQKTPFSPWIVHIWRWLGSMKIADAFNPTFNSFGILFCFFQAFDYLQHSGAMSVLRSLWPFICLQVIIFFLSLFEKTFIGS